MPPLTQTLTLLTLLPPTLSLALTHPSSAETLQARTPTCTPASSGNPSIDDIPAIESALSTCGDGGTIIFPAGRTYYLNSVLDLSSCRGCDIQVEGLLKFTLDTDYWGGRTAMINLEGVEGIHVRSLTGRGVIDGNGQDAYVSFLSVLSMIERIARSRGSY